jgi:hypothetical protein
LGILKGVFLRFITLCSTEKDFDKACDRHDKVFQTRGYITHEVSNIRRNMKRESRRDILIKT